jgi:UDP-glucose 4-epimerase
MRVLVTGGSGFIGSAVVKQLLDKQHNVTVIDKKTNNLNLNDLDLIGFQFDAIMHLAADHIVPDSVVNPLKYYKNNINGVLKVVEYSKLHKTPIIFSSSAAVYDTYDRPLTEDDSTKPINPYGETKLWGERIIENSSKSYGFKYVNLRYFNVAGKGYVCDPPSHVLPIMLNKIKTNTKFTIYGNDYNTRDGTCIRDYVHVDDIARAHVMALDYIIGSGNSDTFNLGSSQGVSVLELFHETIKTLDKQIELEYSNRRKGDPAYLVADASKIKRILGWTPELSLEKTSIDSWEWENRK